MEKNNANANVVMPKTMKDKVVDGVKTGWNWLKDHKWQMLGTAVVVGGGAYVYNKRHSGTTETQNLTAGGDYSREPIDTQPLIDQVNEAFDEPYAMDTTMETTEM